MTRWLIILIGMGLFSQFHVAQAQDTASTGNLCVLAYEDTNTNGTRDNGEAVFPGINVNLAVNTDVIIATHITQESDAYCFENLAPNTYHLYFADSPNHQATTVNQTALEIKAGDRLRVVFGAVATEPVRTEAEAANTGETLTASHRVMIALLGAVVVMVFMLGFGIVLASVLY